MIKMNELSVYGCRPALHGMRNAMESWGKSDSYYDYDKMDELVKMSRVYRGYFAFSMERAYVIGPKDKKLALKLRKAGGDHRKYLRMIQVWVDITAPLYWWKEFDTYKVGTTANSTSTMHRIHTRDLTRDDFSCEDLGDLEIGPNCTHGFDEGIDIIIREFNLARKMYHEKTTPFEKKKYWRTMIQLLPSSFNQMRTVNLNYEVLARMYESRRNHKLSEWAEFCEYIEKLPNSWLITGEDPNECDS